MDEISYKHDDRTTNRSGGPRCSTLPTASQGCHRKLLIDIEAVNNLHFLILAFSDHLIVTPFVHTHGLTKLYLIYIELSANYLHY